MTITDAMIEAGARALCRSDQLSPDALVTNLTAFRGQPLWKTYAVKAKAALEAAERAAWRPIEEAPKDGTEVLLSFADGSDCLVIAHWNEEGPKDALGHYAWATLDGPSFNANAFSHFRPPPTPGEPDER